MQYNLSQISLITSSSASGILLSLIFSLPHKFYRNIHEQYQAEAFPRVYYIISLSCVVLNFFAWQQKELTKVLHLLSSANFILFCRSWLSLLH